MKKVKDYIKEKISYFRDMQAFAHPVSLTYFIAWENELKTILKMIEENEKINKK